LEEEETEDFSLQEKYDFKQRQKRKQCIWGDIHHVFWLGLAASANKGAQNIL